MDIKHISIFRQTEEIRETVVLTDICDGKKQIEEKQNGKSQNGALQTKRKQEYKTKQIIVPAKYLLEYLAYESEVEYTIVLTLRLPNGGICQSIKNRLELCKWTLSQELEQASLTHIQMIHNTLYVDFSRNGRYEVDKKWLPDAKHMGRISKQEVIQLWGLINL